MAVGTTKKNIRTHISSRSIDQREVLFFIVFVQRFSGDGTFLHIFLLFFKHCMGGVFFWVKEGFQKKRHGTGAVVMIPNDT